MAKKFKLGALLAMVIGIIVMIAIGGAFVSGMFMDVVILKWLPLIIHQTVGWLIIAGAIISALLALIGK